MLAPSVALPCVNSNTIIVLLVSVIGKFGTSRFRFKEVTLVVYDENQLKDQGHNLRAVFGSLSLGAPAPCG